jgi:opacity protein-like surface antigen
MRVSARPGVALRLLGRAALASAIVFAAAPARADITAFIGANTTPDNRLARGAAIGTGLLILGFEFEYSSTSETTTAPVAPSLRTGMGNLLLQTPFAVLGFQPYVTGGLGIYRETLGADHDTGVGLNTGAGVKISLAGPLRLRVDYRVFKLGSGAHYSPAHRVYAGLNLKF